MDLVTKRSKTQDDEYYLVLAFAERNKSDDPKSRLVAQSGVGATIVNHGQIVSQSANVLPPKLKNRFTAEGIDVGEAERYHLEAERYHLIEHAERAAIFIALLDG
jgi:deoxycytidylate deaminase